MREALGQDIRVHQDRFRPLANLNSMIFPATPQVVTLDSYFDANVNVGYHINDRFSVYARGNNLAGNNYNRWQNYPVQGIQVLGGATYKFDF